MRKITLICVGNLKEKYLIDAVNEYKKRISKFFDFEIVEIPEARLQKNNQAEIEAVIKNEGNKILEKIKGKKVCVLAIEGKEMSSTQFADFVAKESDFCELCFVISSYATLAKAIKKSTNKVHKTNLSAFMSLEARKRGEI